MDGTVTSQTEALELLKTELAFLESGGYKYAPRSPWRAGYIFEESPSCPNFSNPRRPHRCEDCWLMKFVTPEHRSEQVPCRFVELANDMTVDSLYRCGTLAESEAALRSWLQKRIHEMQEQLREAKDVLKA